MATRKRRATKKYQSKIKGHLDIFTYGPADDSEDRIENLHTVMIHGDPEGLRSFATLLLEMADLNQNDIPDLPHCDSEHIHLNPKFDLSMSSTEVIVGRLDAKGTGEFYLRYVPRKRNGSFNSVL